MAASIIQDYQRTSSGINEILKIGHETISNAAFDYGFEATQTTKLGRNLRQPVSRERLFYEKVWRMEQKKIMEKIITDLLITTDLNSLEPDEQRKMIEEEYLRIKKGTPAIPQEEDRLAAK
ncbi:MAG: hypothetical protein WC752_00890 [Patescibacteria group bacterium]